MQAQATVQKRIRLHSSTKIALGAAVIAAGSYFGWRSYASYVLDRTNFQPIKPGHFSIVGINPGAGYRIIVANDVAQLLKSDTSKFGAGEMKDDSSGNENEGGERKRIPLKEMLQVMQGNEVALGKFIMGMDDDLHKAETEGELAPKVWKAEDIQKALDGDKSVAAELVKDLNVELDGTPAGEIRRASLDNGITIDAPVPIDVMIEGKARRMVGRIQFTYVPRFCVDVREHYKQDFNQTNATVEGYYILERQKIADGKREKEDVRNSLSSRISPKYLARFAEAPKRVLDSATIVLNENFVNDASYKEELFTNGSKLYRIDMDLNDEGRMRLWKFSRTRIGSQLLVVVDGVAVAAPRVRHELYQSNQSITQIRDEGLVQQTVNALNKGKEGK